MPERYTDHQLVVAGGGAAAWPFYHVPQQSRREKLRYPQPDVEDAPHQPLPLLPSPPPPPSSLYYHLLQLGQTLPPYAHPVSLSLSSTSSFTPSLHHPNYPFDYHSSDDLVGCGTTGDGSSTLSRPFTGYAAVLLEGSRYLTPAKQLLQEACAGGALNLLCADDQQEALAMEMDHHRGGGMDGVGVASRLISMLDEVHRRYKQYYQQIHAIIMSFESVAGLSNIAPYTPFALKSLSNHFRYLKDSISNQLQIENEAFGKDAHLKENMMGFVTPFYQGVAYDSKSMGQAHGWRPQRGLPEGAVSVLKAWLFEHFLHPYPTDADKCVLAKQTGLSRNQVSNWFINARVRLWKPLVEEIHSLDQMQHGSKAAESDKGQLGYVQSQLNITSKQQAQCDLPRDQDPPSKRIRCEVAETSSHVVEPLDFTFEGLSNHHNRVHLVEQGFPTAGNDGVSLTLGLHQNNGVLLPKQLPLSVARRFGIEDGNVSYIISRLKSPEWQLEE